MTRRLPLLSAPLLLAVSGVTANAQDHGPDTVVELARDAGKFRTLLTCVEAAGLAGALQGDGPFTVFAPTDAAFDELGSATLAGLLTEPGYETLGKILKMHVVAGRVPASKVAHAEAVSTLAGPVDITKKDGGIYVGGAKVVKTDLKAGNGIVHVIDSVIVPPSRPDLVDLAEMKSGDFSTLLTAVKTAGLAEVLGSEGPFTVFAPTNSAFAKLPAGTVESLLKPENRDKLVSILELHVVPGTYDAKAVLSTDTLPTLAEASLEVARRGDHVYVGGARVTTPNTRARNGIVHVIDRVILPDTKPTVVGLAAKAGQFDTLLAAVKTAGLLETLKGDGPFTVFAPTDSAFRKLGKDTIHELLQPQNRERLKQILTYHVVAGEVDAAAAVEAGAAETLQGGSVEIVKDYGKVKVDGATVVKPNLEASNGIVHVIDTVLIPQSH